MNILVTIIFGVVMFGAVATIHKSNTEYSTFTETEAISPTPYNVSLDYQPESVTNITNGSVEIGAANYTVFKDAQRIQIDNNRSLTGGLSVVYEAKGDSYISGVASAMVAVVMLVLGVGIGYSGLRGSVR